MSRPDPRDDRRVVPFRRPVKPVPKRVPLRQSLMLFAILLAAGLVLTILLGGGVPALAELATAFLFALALGVADFVRRRRERIA